MYVLKSINVFIVIISLAIVGCSDMSSLEVDSIENQPLNPKMSSAQQMKAAGGALTANGWYEGEEIYYIHNGVEEGITERGENDIYLIGGDRVHQANVVEFIPGEPGYSPHWNVYVVHSAEGVTVQDILDSGFGSAHYDSEGVLFDDVEDLRAALQAGLVTFDRPGIVVHCPIISEKGAEAPGNTELSEEFEPFGETF